ncbi:hypothetical protein OPV22_026450 [Ensete ventricosum]|uniref:Uncharacterized protein n=1 Tax=Ensete ventricosum TaxID=4639 RepID=A0AAV8QI36_ENSVE|nr:hypothetical protein OPV22_026450 [Ensete ventricosum]
MAAVSLLCRSLRLHLSFALFRRHDPSLFASSPLAASPVPSIPLGHGKTPRWSLLSLPFFASSNNISADDNLMRLIDSEIHCAQKWDTHNVCPNFTWE